MEEELNRFAEEWPEQARLFRALVSQLRAEFNGNCDQTKLHCLNMAVASEHDKGHEQVLAAAKKYYEWFKG